MSSNGHGESRMRLDYIMSNNDWTEEGYDTQSPSPGPAPAEGRKPRANRPQYDPMQEAFLGYLYYFWIKADRKPAGGRGTWKSATDLFNLMFEPGGLRRVEHQMNPRDMPATYNARKESGLNSKYYRIVKQWAAHRGWPLNAQGKVTDQAHADLRQWVWNHVRPHYGFPRPAELNLMLLHGVGARPHL